MTAFDNSKYYSLQKKAIEDRVSKFSNRLYLEIGGKFLYDLHAKSILPGFDPEIKVKIIKEFLDDLDILFCINGQDILDNRLLKAESISFEDDVLVILGQFEQTFGIKPKIVVNRLGQATIDDRILLFIKKLENLGFFVAKRFLIEKYPNNIDTIISSEGFGKDDYIELNKKLIIVSGAASNSGKLSTAMGQVYLDSIHNIDSGYAKYELFPIWNLPLEHPVNLAYEAATADIGDYNLQDHYHHDAYGIDSVNYNRDVEAFEVLKLLADKIVPENNFIRSYKSPTDMGINMAGFCILDDKQIREAAIQEIIRRRDIYKKEFLDGRGKEGWYLKCEELLKKASQGQENHS